jgi:hypothetical protein
MLQALVEKTADHIVESAHQASRATSAVASAFEEGVAVTKRAVKKSGDAAEELWNEATDRLQRHLVLTVAMTFAVGVTSGAMVGWMMKRSQSLAARRKSEGGN